MMLQTDKTALYGRLKEVFSIICGTAVLIICLSVLCAFSIVKNVVIDDGYGRVISVVTMKSTVRELLDEQQITLNEGDIISHSLESGIKQEDKIRITRSVGITITADGEEKHLKTTATDVQQALTEAKISLGELDECNYPLKDKLFDGMKVVVVRVEKFSVNEDSAIKFNVVKQNDSNLNSGVEKTVREGQDGILTKTYTVVKRDGVETSRTLTGETVTKPAVDKLISVGTKLNFELGAKLTADQLKSKKSIVMNATAYDAGFESCGKHPGDPGYGITATGMQAVYGVVAVDPNIIPLGTKLYVTSADGSYVYGCAIAADTGGAIKGNKIDLFYNSRNEALQFGRRNVVVYFL